MSKIDVNYIVETNGERFRLNSIHKCFKDATEHIIRKEEIIMPFSKIHNNIDYEAKRLIDYAKQYKKAKMTGEPYYLVETLQSQLNNQRWKLLIVTFKQLKIFDEVKN